MRSGLLAEGSSYGADSAGGKLSDVSRELQVIGARLETIYPNLYQNVARQVNITLKVHSTPETILYIVVAPVLMLRSSCLLFPRAETCC